MASVQRRVWAGLLGGWAIGSLAATAVVLLKVGLGAVATVLPLFVIVTGVWIGLATPFALYSAHHGRLNSRGVYGFAMLSSLLAAAACFLFFVYFLMFCLPVAFFVAAAVFNRIALARGGPEASLLDRASP